ncbi:hypothetical protein AB0383_48625 [Amycolatopsis sp. NPDC051373]|uniref:hypothetical protein n=1 Tax=Amycolatopsis sp. NPDC051373 TaxID=3155801 RepID=UPI00344D9CE5
MSFTVDRAEQPQDRFLILANDFVRGKLPVPLHAVARCLLQYFLSLPNGWRCDRAQLDRSMLEGRDAVTRGLKELEAAGYLVREKHRGDHGKWLWSWRVTADPVNAPLVVAGCVGSSDADDGGSATSSGTPPKPFGNPSGNPSIGVPPSTGNPSMDPTSGNTTNTEVNPSTGNPSTGTQGIIEDGSEKTDSSQKTEEDFRTSSGGALAEARTSSAPASQIVKDKAGEEKRTAAMIRKLKPLGIKALTRELTSVWMAVVRENGADYYQFSMRGWDVDGTSIEGEKHPGGSAIKAALESYVQKHDDPTFQGLDHGALLDQVRAHAVKWANEFVDEKAKLRSPATAA